MAAREPARKIAQHVADERSLVEAAQRDPVRFGELYEIYFESVYGFVARRVGGREVAEDLTADVFQRALAQLPRYEWRGAPFGAWLIRIAANLLSDYHKRSAREQAGAVDELPDPVSEPDIEAVEDRARLFRFAGDLPGDQRRVIFGRFVEEKSVREIARELGKTEGAVKQLQLRALQKLRKQMEGADD